MIHRHHVIPRHMGGSDDPSNIIELTVEEHAAAHKELYEKYGKEEDKFAWLGLSGQIGKEEIVEYKARLGALNANANGAYLKGNAKHVERMKSDPEYNAEVRRKQSKPKSNKENYKGPKSAEQRENMKRSALARERVPCCKCGKGFTKANLAKHEKGCKVSSFGKTV
jgi:HNH endonuclease.